MDVPSSPMCRPARVIGLRRKVKREGSILATLDVNGIKGPHHQFKGTVPAVKRKEPFNPFKKNESKHDKNEDDAFEIVERRLPSNKYSASPSLLDESANMAPLSLPVEKKPQPECPTYTRLPIDWSLKCKVRFASSKPFPWRGTLKTCEEASGVTSFARCLNDDDTSVDSSANAKFHQQCMTWIHPALPWLKLFPRIDAVDEKSKIPLSELQDCFHSDWCSSLRSVHQLLRAQQCAFYYLCAPTFTVLFRAAGVGGFSDIHALMTPTTSGLRQALKEEGISFTLPLNNSMSTMADDSSPNEEYNERELNNDNNDEVKPIITAEEDEDETFLQSLGLSQDDFPTFNPKRRKIELKSENIDGRGKSLILIEGNDIQPFINFLLTSRHCTSTTGSLAGVPPTLLAPCAFNGAVMRPLKVRQGWVKHCSRDMHCIEISGPIMLNNLNGLCALFGDTQEGQFEVLLANHQPTVPFSWVPSPKNTFTHPAFATANLKDSGLGAGLLPEVCRAIETPTGALAEITLADFLYRSKFI